MREHILQQLTRHAIACDDEHPNLYFGLAKRPAHPTASNYLVLAVRGTPNKNCTNFQFRKLQALVFWNGREFQASHSDVAGPKALDLLDIVLVHGNRRLAIV